MVTAKDLERVRLFAGSGERILTKIQKIVRELAFKPDQAVCFEGEPPGSMYVIRSGRVSIEKHTENGPLLLAKLGRWDFFGEMGAILGEPRTATVRAIGPTEVLEIPRRDLLDLIQAHPLIGIRIRNEIIHRQAETVRKVVEQSSGAAAVTGS